MGHLDRYDHIQRLDTTAKTIQQQDDEEQAAYLAKWTRENPDGDNFMHYAIGFLCVIILVIGLFAKFRTPSVIAVYNVCTLCHFPDAHRVCIMI